MPNLITPDHFIRTNLPRTGSGLETPSTTSKLELYQSMENIVEEEGLANIDNWADFNRITTRSFSGSFASLEYCSRMIFDMATASFNIISLGFKTEGAPIPTNWNWPISYKVHQTLQLNDDLADEHPNGFYVSHNGLCIVCLPYPKILDLIRLFVESRYFEELVSMYQKIFNHPSLDIETTQNINYSSSLYNRKLIARVGRNFDLRKRMIFAEASRFESVTRPDDDLFWWNGHSYATETERDEIKLVSLSAFYNTRLQQIIDRMAEIDAVSNTNDIESRLRLIVEELENDTVDGPTRDAIYEAIISDFSSIETT